MWVLSTARAELHYFCDCAAVSGGYAILSHTWTQDTAGEQTFQDVQDIIKECKITATNPRDRVGEKVRRCCEIAESDGYDWVWIDSCCIDKTSSTELSEAINSMFDWYALSEICYVYLEDVPHTDNPFKRNSRFQTSRWHLRGWTLQELLAPTFVIFFSKEWKKIGTKYELRRPLSRCTDINVKYLTRKRDFRVHASIATRMSWAAKRKTTRVEDEAYCLLGLFDINMPTMYGEGRHALQRLQAELARQSTDATLFAWGYDPLSSDDELEQCDLSDIHGNDPGHPYIFLFAPSLRHFGDWWNTHSSPWTPSQQGPPTSPSSTLDDQPKDSPLSQVRDDVPSFEVTSYSMKCHLPVAEVDGVTIAVLPCQDRGKRLGLLLHPAPNDQTQGPSRQLYYVSWAFTKPNESRVGLYRLTRLGGDDDNLRFRGKPVSPTWRDIYIATHPPTTGRRDGAHLLRGFLPDVAPILFRIPRALIQTLGALGFFPIQANTESRDTASKHVMSFRSENTEQSECIRILLGTCPQLSAKGHLCHWAWAEPRYHMTWEGPWPEHVHNCAADHIANWPNGTREFGDATRTIRLVFAPCTHASERTLVLGLELVGSRYEEIQRDANIHLPPPVRYPARRLERETTSIQALAEDLRDMSITSLNSNPDAVPDQTHNAAVPRACSTRNPDNIPDNLCDALQRLREHEAQIRTLTEAFESQQAEFARQQAEFAQLKALFAQVL